MKEGRTEGKEGKEGFEALAVGEKRNKMLTQPLEGFRTPLKVTRHLQGKGLGTQSGFFEGRKEGKKGRMERRKEGREEGRV